MSKWYKIPVDYNEVGELQPKYADGFKITYFGDKPFNGYTGTKIGEYYISKISTSETIHEKLQQQEDVVVLSNEEVKDILDYRFMQNYPFEVWDSKFKI